MLLHSFRVQWFKNFRQEIVLDDLGPLNVIHGANNVGKSNLVEAIALFFALLDEIAINASSRPRVRDHEFKYPGETPSSSPGLYRTTTLEPLFLHRRGFAAEDIFNKRDAKPIQLQATFTVTLGELEAAGIAVPVAFERVLLELSLTRKLAAPSSSQLELAIERFSLISDAHPGGHDVEHDALALLQSDPEKATFVHELTGFLAWPPRPTEVPALRYALIQVDRNVTPRSSPSQAEDTTPKTSRALIPGDLWLTLFDAQQSSDRAQNQMVALFFIALERFGEVIGDGSFELKYDRLQERADLVFKGPDDTPIPIHLLGSGVQQVTGLLGRLLTTGASFLAIEEPELNLRHTEQLALAEALYTLATKDEEPSQVILTSHSPAFEKSAHFYAMSVDHDDPDNGPVLDKRPSSEARVYTQYDVGLVPGPGQSAPLCYVSSEGLVVVPANVRRELGVAHGGGVRFIRNKRTDHYEILNTEQFLDILEDVAPDGDGAGADDDDDG